MTHINPINRFLSRVIHDHGEFSRCQFEPEKRRNKREKINVGELVAIHHARVKEETNGEGQTLIKIFVRKSSCVR